VNILSTLGGLFHIFFYEPTYNLLMFVYSILHSFPLAIVGMTLILRTFMIPLFMKQLQSQKAMQELAPQIQAIQKEYKAEPMESQKRVSALYKENGVNPLAGCLPLLVQMPFLWGLYGAFQGILKPEVTASLLNNDLYPFVRPFFGPNGLTQIPNMFFFGLRLDHISPFPFILPVIAGLLTFIQLRMAAPKPKPQTAVVAGQPDASAATMKMMQYMMPLLTLFMGTRFQAGLALYWCVTTSFTVGQQYFVNGRNWGPLLDGIPGIAKYVPTSAVPAIVDAAPIRRQRTRVTEVKESPKALAQIVAESVDSDSKESDVDVQPQPARSAVTAKVAVQKRAETVRFVPAAITSSGAMQVATSAGKNTLTNQSASTNGTKARSTVQGSRTGTARPSSQNRKKK